VRGVPPRFLVREAGRPVFGPVTPGFHGHPTFASRAPSAGQQVDGAVRNGICRRAHGGCRRSLSTAGPHAEAATGGRASVQASGRVVPHGRLKALRQSVRCTQSDGRLAFCQTAARIVTGRPSRQAATRSDRRGRSHQPRPGMPASLAGPVEKSAGGLSPGVGGGTAATGGFLPPGCLLTSDITTRVPAGPAADRPGQGI
jgi:hypothetical protein